MALAADATKAGSESGETRLSPRERTLFTTNMYKDAVRKINNTQIKIGRLASR